MNTLIPFVFEKDFIQLTSSRYQSRLYNIIAQFLSNKHRVFVKSKENQYQGNKRQETSKCKLNCSF